MKPVDVKPSTYIDFSEEIHNKCPKFKIADVVRISAYKNIFAKDCIRNCSEIFMIKEAKNIVLWPYVIYDLNGQEIVETSYKR